MKNKEAKIEKPKQVVEYFTDEMAKNMYLFQDKLSHSSKSITKTISFAKRKK